MKKIDIILALVTGEVTAWFFYGLLKNMGVDFTLLYFALPVVFPVLAVIGLWISWLLGKKFVWIFQIAKFMLIGVLATLVDLGILNLLILVSGVAAGVTFSVFKGISFLFATSSKYFGDKFWAFEKMEKSGMKKEFGKFFLVTLVGLVINVGIASLIVNVFGSQLNLSENILANIGGIAAAFSAAAWNFVGYKFIVFKK